MLAPHHSLARFEKKTIQIVKNNHLYLLLLLCELCVKNANKILNTQKFLNFFIFGDF